MPETFGQRLARSFKAGLTPDPSGEDRGDPVAVKEYRDRGAYERGAQDMAARGYAVISVVEQSQNAGCLRIMTLGLFALVVRPRPHFVVTYQKQA